MEYKDEVINEIKAHGFVMVREDGGRYYFDKGNARLEYTVPCKDTGNYNRIRGHIADEISEWHDNMYICYYFDEMFDSMFSKIRLLCE